MPEPRSKLQRIVERAAPALALCLVALHAAPAAAYNGREHERLPDQAYQILNTLRRGDGLQLVLQSELEHASHGLVRLLSDRPDSVPASEQARWDRFIAEARLAPSRLDLLLTDLVNPAHPSDQCRNAYPVLTAGQQLAACRAGELSFAPRRQWGEKAGTCYLRLGYHPDDGDHPDFLVNDLTTTFNGALLGLWAEQPDDENDDTHLFVKPLSVLLLSQASALIDDVVGIGVAIVLAPFACLAALFTGDNCIDELIDVARSTRPIEAIANAVPGVGDWDGNDLFSTTGVWHFVDVERSGTGAFNNVPGLHYTAGGFHGVQDLLDHDIISMGDLTGLTLNAGRSLGVRRYSPFEDGPDRPASTLDWQAQPIGHVEFEPAQNLAMFGWHDFLATHSRISGFGWVLHAIGDASEPHHVISATGWGHRPFEDMSGAVWPGLFNEGLDVHYFDMLRIVEQAYTWWKFLDDGQGGVPTHDIPLRDFIVKIAQSTRDLSENDAYVPNVSLNYSLFHDGDPVESVTLYNGLKPGAQNLARTLLTQGMAASVAFLVKAGGLATPTTGNTPCTCAPGTGRWATGRDGTLIQTGFCSACGQAPFGDLPFSLDGQCVGTCPFDRPLSQGGNCVATCPGGGCTGVICNDRSAPLVENGVCVSECHGGVLVDNRECRATCPAGQAPNLGVCLSPPPPPPVPPCAARSADATASCACTVNSECAATASCFAGHCCRARAATCADDRECCSGSCSKIDHLCRGRFDERCAQAADCITGVCSGDGFCSPGPSGAACVTVDDCVGRRCAAGTCAGLPGDSCSRDTDCLHGACTVATHTCCGAADNACNFNSHCCDGLACHLGTCIPILP
jgi:hypothetical protein